MRLIKQLEELVERTRDDAKKSQWTFVFIYYIGETFIP